MTLLTSCNHNRFTLHIFSDLCIYLQPVPSIHLFNARYKEQIRDFNGARKAFPKFDREELHPNFISNVMEQANMERRLVVSTLVLWNRLIPFGLISLYFDPTPNMFQGNYEVAYRIYREAIELTTERKKMNMLSCLYMNYSRLTYTVWSMDCYCKPSRWTILHQTAVLAMLLSHCTTFRSYTSKQNKKFLALEDAILK